MEGSGDGDEKKQNIYHHRWVLCLKRKIMSYLVPSKPSSPFLAFACVEKVDGDADFAAGVGGEGGVEV